MALDKFVNLHSIQTLRFVLFINHILFCVVFIHTTEKQVIAAELMWCQVLRKLQHIYVNFQSDSSGIKPVRDFERSALFSTVRLCRLSSTVTCDGYKWNFIMHPAQPTK